MKLIDSIAAVELRPTLRGKGGRMPLWLLRLAQMTTSWTLIVSIVAFYGAVHAQAGEVRWRVFDEGDGAFLVIADNDATDNFGSPLFHCRKASGLATAEGDTNEALRRAIAALLHDDRYPTINLMPDDSSAQGIEAFYSELTGWRYRFMLSVIDPAFEQLKRAGSFQFKVDDAFVRDEFRVGLENVAKFQELCKSLSK